MASLLGDLWVLAGDGEKEPTVESRRAGLEMSYAQAVSSHSSEGHCSRDSVDSKGFKGAADGKHRGVARLAGSKRSRSPKDAGCGRCFRSSHSTSECRHQVVCRRYDGVGHVAARCKVVLRWGPYRSRIHVRSKKLMSSST